jgi:hypothetical protein
VSLDSYRNKYIASNINTNKKIIIDASMSCTRHGLWNILSLLTIAGSKPILMIMPDQLSSFYYEELNILINPVFPVIAITRITKAKDFHKISNPIVSPTPTAFPSPIANITMISLSNIKNFSLSGKSVSALFEHFMFKGHLPPTGKIFLRQTPPKNSGITLFLLKKIFANAKKVIIDAAPCSDAVTISALYEIAESMGVTSNVLPWIDSDFFHVNTELASNKVLHKDVIGVPLKAHTQSPIDPKRFK